MIEHSLDRDALRAAVSHEWAKLPRSRRARVTERISHAAVAGSTSTDLLSCLDDQTLGQLGQFFDVGEPAPAGWSEPGLRIFASHLSSTRGRFVALKNTFALFGANLFFAHDDINGGALWQRSLLDALQTMDALLAIHSPGFHASAYCNQEVGFALARSVPIVSLMDGEPPCGFIGEAQGFPYREDQVRAFVSRALTTISARSPARFSVAIARTLKRATDYAHADMLTEQLVGCGMVTAEAMDQINLAVRFNDQVYESGNVTRLAELAARHGYEVWPSRRSRLAPHTAHYNPGNVVLKSDFDPFAI